MLPEEALIILLGFLAVMTIGAAAEYYRRLEKARREYERARTAIDDIIVSFNRQFKQGADRVEFVAYKVEAALSKSEKISQKAEDSDKRILDLEKRVNSIIEDNDKLLAKLSEFDGKARNIETSQESLASKLLVVQEQIQRLPPIPEAKIEAVIPIRREKALARLTETELSVLEMLSSEGSKTAPEIKSKIELSREHTARLMKKLYEDGYLERDTSKIPFKYSAKKEMEKLLKKSETEPTQSN